VSYVRWGSTCQATIDRMPEDEACPDATCPGSALYIYDGTDNSGKDAIVCCCCSLASSDGDYPENFCAYNDVEMAAHLEQHVAAGHHTRLSVLAFFRAAAKNKTAPTD
jgi:hypothetical protein